MKKLLIILLVAFLTTPCYASPPSRTSTYISGTTIRAADVTSNEDAIFNYLQSGVDTFTDDSIYNADVNSAAGILASKLNLTSVSQNITHTGTFTQGSSASFTTITDLGTVTQGTLTAATITTADINGGAIDGTTVGSTTPAAGAFTTLKVGTTNQGDILYDNGTSLVRLTPGTDGQILQTQGTSANPTWASNIWMVDSVAGDYPANTYGTIDGWICDTERFGDDGNTYTLMKEMRIPRSGALRIKFDCKYDGSSGTGNARIYRNGVAVGTEQTLTDTYVTKAEDISGWTAGDLIQIYVKNSAFRVPYIKNFRIYENAPIGGYHVTVDNDL